MKNILRWIAVLPASVLAQILCYVGNIFIINNVIGAFIYPTPSFMSEAIATVMSSMLFIYAGTLVAPSHRNTTALILMTIQVIICSAGIVFYLFTKSGWELTKTIILLVISIIASVYSYKQLCIKENSDDL